MHIEKSRAFSCENSSPDQILANESNVSRYLYLR